MSFAIFAAATAAVILVLVTLAYFVVLQARYPEPAHSDEIHIVMTNDGWRLRLHRRKPKDGGGEPVFFMHSLSSNHLNFEIPYGFSLVDYLTAAGYDCWTFDSRACRDAVPPERRRRFSSTIDDVLQIDIPSALLRIREITGFERVHWVGHSMGGMLLYAYDLRFHGEGLASATTLGAPPGFKGYRHRPHGALLQLNRHAHTLCVYVFRGLAPYFDFWRPVSRLIPINWDNAHPKLRALHLFHAAEMPAPTIGEQMDRWASGEPWTMCNGSLNIDENLHRIATPLLAIFGGLDPFISQARARTFFDAIENRDKKMIYLSRATGSSANYNHIDLAFARNGEQEVFGPILEWIGSHSIARVPREIIPVARPRAVVKRNGSARTARVIAKKRAAPRKRKGNI